MGIDFHVESPSDREFLKDSQDQYCKWAWRNINWAGVFDVLNIKLAVIGDSAINWWAESQVETMRNRIRQLAEGNEDFAYDADQQKRAATLQKDAALLLEHFDAYVAHGARIYVF